MPDDLPTDLPSLDDYRDAKGSVDWKAWRAAAVAWVDEIVRREGESPTGDLS